MTKNLRGGAQPGGRKRGFIRAGTASYSCSISSRPTRDATSISWRVPLPSLNPRFTEDSDYMSGEKEKKLSLGCRTSARMGNAAAAYPNRQPEECGEAGASQPIKPSSGERTGP